MEGSDEVTGKMEAIRALWTTCADESAICLCLSGSAARGEATPASDLDLLLLHDGSQGASLHAQDVLRRIHGRIEHVSVISRSLEDCRVMIQEDLRSWVAQMDSLWVAGDEKLFCSFRKDMRTQAEEMKEEIISRLHGLTVERHFQYGETLALLEPNVKNSAGALRDIHTMYYVALLDRAGELTCDSSTWPSVQDIINGMKLKETRQNNLLHAYVFLLSVRSALHKCAGHLHDTLDFDIQRSVASRLGYGAETDKQAVEAFMREYYMHVHTVHVAMQLIFADHEKNESASLSRLELNEPSENGENILRLFDKACEAGEVVDIELVRILDEHPEILFTSTECMRIFDGIIRRNEHVFSTLSRMHELRILGKILPEFSRISQFFQHNIYHFFTADEHTLRTIRSCEHLASAEEHASRVIHEIKDRSVLYYALLLHDIAKPVDVQRHELVGADMVPEILRRFRRLDCVDDVTFLVREHLRMEQIAFRRNFREESTLAPFVATVASMERLNMLYVLTYADMAALNPGVLTEWKKVLLSELYEAARERLLHGKSEKEPAHTVVSVVEPVSSMDHHYFQTALQDIIDGELMRMHVTHHRAYSEVSIFCVDRPQLLSQLSAAFFGADTSIVDAAIETRNDVVIDMFRVVDIISGKHMSQQQTLELRKLVRNVCAGEINVDTLYEAHKRKWIRRLKKLPQSNIKTAVEYIPHVSTDGGHQTIIEVYAPDTFGLLYRLSGEISLFGLNVVFAKIASRVDGVVDSFYVTDREGKPFENEKKQEELRTRILRQITEPVR